MPNKSNMAGKRKMSTLSAYVKRRLGVPLGAPGSMTRMFAKSFGAGSFYLFWRYWNPIWGYYLAKYVMRPLNGFCATWLATLLTFAASGALHDIAASLVYWEFTFLFTPWFTTMGLLVVVTEKYDISYATQSWITRALINAFLIVATWQYSMLLRFWF